MSAGFHQPMGLGGLGQGEGCVDDRLDLSLVQQGPNFLQKLGSDGGFHRHALRAQSGAGQGQALEHYRQEVNLGLGAAQEGDGGLAAVGGQALDVARQIIAAHHVENNVHALLAGLGGDDLDEVFRAIVDGPVGPQFQAGCAFFGAAGGGENLRAEMFGQLDGGGADAAGAAMDQEALAGGRWQRMKTLYQTVKKVSGTAEAWIMS